MGFYEEKLTVYQVKITNTSGAAYSQGDFVLEQGFFGNVVDPDGIANGAEGTIDVNPDRIIETDQTKAGDTFAESTDETPSVVYFDRTNAYLTDTNAAGLEPVGVIVDGGAADANDVIRFKPYAQSLPAGVVPAGSISSAELAADTIQYATVAVSAAELAALATTPKTIIAAPGANKVIEFISSEIFFDYSADAITGQGDIAFRYTDGSGTIVSDTVASADFLELTADAYRTVQALSADIAATANAAVVLDATAGDPTTGGTITSTLTVKVAYRIHDFS